jgi:hypothetical protein
MSNNNVYYKLYCTIENKKKCDNQFKEILKSDDYGSFNFDQSFRTQSKNAEALDKPPVKTSYDHYGSYEVLTLQKKYQCGDNKSDAFYMYKVGKLIDINNGLFKLDNDELVQTNGGEFYELNDDGTIKRGSKLNIPYLGEVPMSPDERRQEQQRQEQEQQRQEQQRQ